MAKGSAQDARFTSEWLRGLTARGESALVEFKREWHDIDKGPGKAVFIRSMLAMGNAVTTSESGFVILGVEDPARGGAVVGVPNTPGQETVMQLIASYTSPPVRTAFHQVPIASTTVDVLEVSYHRQRPHYAIREIPPDLLKDRVYIRNGATIRTLQIPEIVAMVREGDNYAQQLFSAPLEVAFIGHENWHCGCKILARVTNRTEEPVTQVRAAFDIVMKRFPGAFDRREVVCGATLKGGESIPVELDLYAFPVIHAGQRLSPHANLYNRAVDLTLHVQYADKNGGLRETQTSLTLA